MKLHACGLERTQLNLCVYMYNNLYAYIRCFYIWTIDYKGWSKFA